jgi:hypothetical protein
MTKLAIVLVGLASLLSVSVQAGSLGNYKNQSMGSHKEVTDASCPADYKQECKSKCAANDAACAATCDNGAAKFCEDRNSRRNWKKAEIFAKGASLGAGAAAMIFDDKMGTVSADGTALVSEYTTFWNRPSIFVQAGAGPLQGGTKLLPLAATFRYSWFGMGANLDYMFDDTDKLAELDFGPSFNFGTAHLVFGLQPSALVRAGNGFAPIYGGGLRTLTTYYNGRVFVQFNPLLGYINEQWAYDLKASVGYRITPVVSIDVGFSHRDILNLNDLNISETGLNGAFARLGLRMN